LDLDIDIPYDYECQEDYIQEALVGCPLVDEQHYLHRHPWVTQPFSASAASARAAAVGTYSSWFLVLLTLKALVPFHFQEAEVVEV
jgi:hypothetical protein